MPKPTARRRTATRLLSLLAAVLAAAPLGAVDRAAPLTFGVDLEAINVDVTVSDTAGRYVTDLDERSFRVFEDGVRQQVALFAREERPISVTLLFDTSASMAPRLPLARAAARRLVETLRPSDEVEVVGFNQRVTVLQPLTSDRVALAAAIDRIQTRGVTSLYTALYVALKQAQRQGQGPGETRRAIVLLSDGEDTHSRLSDDDVIRLAKEAGVGVYPVGLPAESAVPGDVRAAQAVYFLTALARETGATAAFPRNARELDAAYARIGEELRAQYSIGYLPQRTADGAWRRIAIQVPGRSDVMIRHKPGYYARR